mgnify:CR=1 FL=1
MVELENREVEIQYGVVGNVYVEDDAISYENGETYSADFIAGKALESHPKYGTFLSILEMTKEKEVIIKQNE